MDNALTAAVLGGAFVSLFLIERAIQLRPSKRRLLPRLLVNGVISVAAFAVAIALVQPAAAAMLGFTEKSSFGLIQLAGLTGALEVVAAFLLLDLSFYYWHVANHRITFLWRFHNVHHIDPDLDVTSAFRFHFVEVAFSAGFRAIQVILIGPSLSTYAIYELLYQLGTLFHHSNVPLPLSIERALNKVLVTPRMHGIHHSDIRDENLSNFGVVFPWWDRLHGTLGLNIPQAEVGIGMPGYSLPEDNGIIRCFTIPFRAQRDYWQAPAGRRLQREHPLKGQRHRLAG